MFGGRSLHLSKEAGITRSQGMPDTDCEGPTTEVWNWGCGHFFAAGKLGSSILFSSMGCGNEKAVFPGLRQEQ